MISAKIENQQQRVRMNSSLKMQGGVNMQWEYLVYYWIEGSLQEKLNEFGRDGWELVGLSLSGGYVFKRPMVL